MARPTRHRAPNLLARLLARTGVPIDRARAPVVATVVVVLVVAALAGAWVLAARPSALPVATSSLPISERSGSDVARSSSAAGSPGPPGPSGSSPSNVPSWSSSATIVVDVAGKVRRPGLYRLPAGSRVDDALRAAGGALSGVDLAALNRAALVADGQQVAVGVPAAANAGGVAGPAAGSGAAARTAAGTANPVHLNSATIEQLETLPGVGPVLAQKILDYRAEHGSFASVNELNDVPGIGDAKFAALRAAVAL
jgi:competence protein ComEA